MFKFGFDIPADEGGDGTDDKDSISMTEENLRTDDGKETHADISTAISSKPAASVLNISDAISSVFESDTLFEYVPVVGDNNSGDNSGGNESTPAVKPLRRVTFPPDQTLPSLLRASNNNNAITTAEATAKISSTCTEGEIIDKESLADTDLIPGVYEGGLKVWECSLDLCRHLADEILRLQSSFEGGDGSDISISANNDVYNALSRTGKTLELGCGHGLPACLIFRELRKRWQNADISVTEGASSEDGYSVLFSDYNEFVLRDATVPNIVLNMDSDRPCPNDKREWEKVQGCVGCVSGDWIDLSNKLQTASLGDADTTLSIPLSSDGRFDLILAAETTYTEESAMDTARVLSRHLRVVTGVGLVATKRYYFGVGGGADAFRQAAADIVVQVTANGDNRRNYRLSIETVQSYDIGVGRDLMRARLVPADL